VECERGMGTGQRLQLEREWVGAFKA
jgi:hypothetical protein